LDLAMSLSDSYGTPFRPLEGAEKVAALLLVMGKPVASRLLGHFEPAELKAITRSAAQLRSVPIEVLEELVEEFATDFTSSADVQGDPHRAEGLLSGVLPPEDVAEIMSEVLGNSNKSTWEKIAGVAPTLLAPYLAGQHPQVVALAVSQLGSSAAAEIMQRLPRDLRNETTRRLFLTGPVADAALRVLETRISQDLIVNPPQAADESTKRIAEIVNRLAPENIDDILRSLAEARPEDAEALKSKLFTFDDLARLPQKARQTLFEKVPSDRIVVALAGTDEAFRTNVLSALTARARRLVETELESAADSPARDIAAARRMIVDTLLSMAARGEVQLRDDEPVE
jgi:flagellar motor switch protein FliG